MRKKFQSILLATATLFGLLSEPTSAQTLISVYDNSGLEVGQPISATFGVSRSTILRPDAIAINVNLETGAVLDDYDPYFVSDDCMGQPYLSDTPQAFDWIVTVGSAESLRPMLLVTKDAVAVTILTNSKINGNGDCMSGLPDNTKKVPVTFINPAEYGFSVTPSGEWGYPPPLKAKGLDLSTVADRIFCNGFECPQQ
ncbi:hypothetical protein ACFL07_00375 [Pseudomonadota bacterium]